MKTYNDFLKEELRKNGHDVKAALDYLDIVSDEVEKAAVLFAMQSVDKYKGLVAERDSKIYMLEIEIKDLTQSHKAFGLESHALTEFLIKMVAREAYDARHTEKGEFEEWWGKRTLTIGDGE